MTAQVVDLHPQVHILPTEPFWTKPEWCAGDCYGGNAEELDGHIHIPSRFHSTDLAAFDARDRDVNTTHPVRVTISRCDDPDGLSEEHVTLHVGDTDVALTYAQRVQLIDALILANRYSPQT